MCLDCARRQHTLHHMALPSVAIHRPPHKHGAKTGVEVCKCSFRDVTFSSQFPLIGNQTASAQAEHRDENDPRPHHQGGAVETGKNGALPSRHTTAS